MADKQIVVTVQAKQLHLKDTIWVNMTTLICQNKFIYEIQYNVLFLFVK